MGGIDGKYGVITAEKKEFYPDEPVFLLRAQDPIAVEAVLAYADLCRTWKCDEEHIAAVERHAARIRGWQEANPTFVKVLPGGTEFRAAT